MKNRKFFFSHHLYDQRKELFEIQYVDVKLLPNLVGCRLLVVGLLTHHTISHRITSHFFHVSIIHTHKNYLLHNYHHGFFPTTFSKSSPPKKISPSRGATPPGHAAAQPSAARSAPVVRPGQCDGEPCPLPSPKRGAMAHWATAGWGGQGREQQGETTGQKQLKTPEKTVERQLLEPLIKKRFLKNKGS